VLNTADIDAVLRGLPGARSVCTPRGRVIVSADVAERYACLPPALARDASAAETAAQLAPDGCAVVFPYYSMEVAGGPRGIAAALDAYERRIAGLNAELPRSLEWVAHGPPTYGLITTTTRATRPTSTALGVLGLMITASPSERRSASCCAGWRGRASPSSSAWAPSRPSRCRRSPSRSPSRWPWPPSPPRSPPRMATRSTPAALLRTE
jgi:hypothetical protein